MVDLSIADGNLVLHVRGADKLWAFKADGSCCLLDQRPRGLAHEHQEYCQEQCR